MKIIGLDFSSSMTTESFIVSGTLEGDVLSLDTVTSHRGGALQVALSDPGEWVLGLDVPFSLPGVFVDAQRWEAEWEAYVDRLCELDRPRFKDLIDSYRAGRPEGQREPKRQTDLAARSLSPLKVANPPLALMFS